MEIKIQEDYSDLEGEDAAKGCERKSARKESAGERNKEDANKLTGTDPTVKEAKASEEEDTHRKVKMVSGSKQDEEKDSLSVTIKSRVKIASKIGLCDKGKDRATKRKKARRERERSRKSDKAKSRNKERAKAVDSKQQRHREDDSSKGSKSRDKKKDDSHRSKRQRSKSRSASLSPRKKIKSQIDSSSKYKSCSSKSHRK